MDKNEKWLEWAVELQSIAQAGLYYCKDEFDKERYERIRSIAAEMIAYKSKIPIEKVRDLFCSEIGYQTPKIDTRAAVFKDKKILLVKEKDGRWSLPGGWANVDISVTENVIKEVKEEAGLDVSPELIIAVQDREKHNRPVYAYKVCKIFFLCSVKGGRFAENIETTESRYFGVDELPDWQRKRIIKNRLRCVLKHMPLKTGKHYLTEKIKRMFAVRQVSVHERKKKK